MISAPNRRRPLNGNNQTAMKRILLLLLFALVVSCPSFAQTTGEFNKDLEKTGNIKVVNGQYYYLHIVRAKQTLYAICKLYDVSMPEIMALNKMKQPEITVGQLLMIPAKDLNSQNYPAVSAEEQVADEVRDTANYLYLQVKPKETLYHLSKEYNVSIEDIKKVNDNLTEGLRANTTIKIPKIQIPSAGVSSEIVPSAPVVRQQDTATTVRPENELFNRTNQTKYVAADDKTLIVNDTVVTFITHSVQSKETVYSIAKKYSVTPEDIIKYNPSAARTVKRSQLLRIPVFNIKETVVLKKVENQEVQLRRDSIQPSSQSQILVADSLPCVKQYKKFNIALLLPLYIEDVQALEVSYSDGKVKSGTTRSFKFVQYYQGALMAIDSLTKMGMNVELFVYDVDETVEKAQTLVSDNRLKDMDIIIGPFYKRTYDVVCEYAKRHNVPIVNPVMSSRSNSCDYLNAFKMSVDNSTQMAYIANYILSNYPNSNIVIYTPRTPSAFQQKDIDFLTERLSKAIPEKVKYMKADVYNILVDASAADTSLIEGELYDRIVVDDVTYKKDALLKDPTEYIYIDNKVNMFNYASQSVAGYTKYLSRVRPNVVISFAEEHSDVVDNLSRLNTMSGKYDIHLFGNKSWIYKDLDFTSLQKTDFHTCSNAILNYRSRRVEDFVNAFAEQYVCEPNKFAFLGFDTFFYFLNMLYNFGDDFYRYVSTISYQGLANTIFFNRVDAYPSYENFSSGIYRMGSFEWQLMPSSDYIWETSTIDMSEILYK